MKIIDAHMHTIVDEEFKAWNQKYKIDFSEKGLKKECAENNIQHALSLACELDRPTPMGWDSIKKQQKRNPRLKAVVGINPNFKITPSQKNQIELGLKNKEIKAIKIYLGYFHYYAHDKIYHPFYKMAAKYNQPLIFHTGDTFGGQALLKYSHPLTIDEVAVNFPKTKFVIAHIGEPWVVDAAAVIYKNTNVYADLSGLVIGKIDAEYQAEMIPKIKYVLNYVGNYKKFMYGSDWPLIKMADYIKLIKKAVPSKFHKDVFYNNAAELFNLK